MGKQFSTCGIGLRAPDKHIGDPRMKRLCPKLVPGQVVELPVTHPLIKKRSPHIEIVQGPEVDEIIRPWVFPDELSAAAANPSKAGRLTDEQLAQGLALTHGAIENAPDHRKKAQEERAEVDEDDDDYFEDDDDYEEDDDVDDGYKADANNKMTRGDKAKMEEKDGRAAPKRTTRRTTRTTRGR